METTTVTVTKVPRAALVAVAPYASKARIAAGAAGEDSEAATMRYALVELAEQLKRTGGE